MSDGSQNASRPINDSLELRLERSKRLGNLQLDYLKRLGNQEPIGKSYRCGVTELHVHFASDRM